MKVNIFKNTKIFADGANYDEMVKLSKASYIKGLTTNPSLMKKNGIKNYADFAKKILKKIKKKPISFEVFSDDLNEMKKQGLVINSWGKNVYVKIPITNAKKSTASVIKFCLKRYKSQCDCNYDNKAGKRSIKKFKSKSSSCISIFAGELQVGRDQYDNEKCIVHDENKNLS